MNKIEYSAITEKTKQRFNSNIIKPNNINDCWLWKGSNRTNKGYGQFMINNKLFYAHRVSLFLHLKTWGRDKDVVMHKCDNPHCVNPLHLQFGSYKDNNQDKINKNRHPKTYNKIASEVITAIKNKYIENPNISNGELSRNFNVKEHTTRRIILKLKETQAREELINNTISDLLNIIDNTPNN